MTGGRPAAAVALAAGAVAALWEAPAGRLPGPAPAAAADHRAGVLIDTGTQVKRVCLHFPEDSISGVEALARANVQAVFQGYTGKGIAVCALCGVGCPAGESCLTCDAGGRYWSYSRAPAGTSVLRTSPVGASSTEVHDGDVEGWKWGLGGIPPFATVEEICDGTAPTTTTAAATTSTAPAGTAVTTTTAAAPGTTRPATGSTRPPATAASPTTAAPTTATTAPQAATTAPAAPTTAAPSPPVAAPATPPAAGGGGGGWAGLAAFAAVLGALAAWTVRVRRRRR